MDDSDATGECQLPCRLRCIDCPCCWDAVWGDKTKQLCVKNMAVLWQKYDNFFWNSTFYSIDVTGLKHDY